jgi:peptidoglycan/LPS O-acetylase OafA/YrhL
MWNFSSSLDSEFKKHGGVGPGFDLVRFGLAVLIFYGHCFWIILGSNIGPGHPTVVDGTVSHSVPVIWAGQTYFRRMLVPMFFAVSGFLVTGSAFRTKSLRVFLTFRILRIVPALATEITLSALILGPIFTTLALRDYFTDPLFFDYFGNIIGRVRMLLPGLFLENSATRAVNANLWTLPAEFYCYLIVAILLAAGLLAHRVIFSLLFAAATIALIGLESFTSLVDQPTNNPFSNTLIVYYFFCGCMIFHWKHLTPYNFGIFALAVTVAYFLNRNGTMYLAPIFVSYVIIFIGMTKLPRLGLIQSGDYSYGVYLYGFPIAQALVALVPQFRGHGWYLFAVAAALTFSFASFSWHFIEKPTLALKRRFASSKPAQVFEAQRGNI